MSADHDDGTDYFRKLDGAEYDRLNEFIRDRTYLTAREWAVLVLSQHRRTETGIEMTAVGQQLPEAVPFIDEEFSPQNVGNARRRAREKTIRAGATFLYASMSGVFDSDEVDDIMHKATETAKFVLEMEGADVSLDDELQAEKDVGARLRQIRKASKELRDDGTE